MVAAFPRIVQNGQGMSGSAIERESLVLAGYIGSLVGFRMPPVRRPYGHIAATIVDAVLQVGVSYEKIVRPRVERVMREYPEAGTTGAFLRLLDRVGPAVVVNWKGPTKLALIAQIARLLQSEGVETEGDLRDWISVPENVEKLKRLKGVGNQMADYLAMLVGVPTAPPDRLILSFFAQAGIQARRYGEAREILKRAAGHLGVSPEQLIRGIWDYQHGLRRKSPPPTGNTR